MTRLFFSPLPDPAPPAPLGYAVPAVSLRRDTNRMVMVPAEWVASAREIVGAVCKEHNTCVKDVLGKSRFTEHQVARHEAVRRIKAAIPAISTPQIAAFFRMHHTTVLYVLGRRGRGAAHARA